jgi:hypothetical protein
MISQGKSKNYRPIFLMNIVTKILNEVITAYFLHIEINTAACTKNYTHDQVGFILRMQGRFNIQK